MPLYHTEIGFPSNLPPIRPIIGLVPSKHAENARWDDRYGMITLPKIFNPNYAKVIEIETDNLGNIVKILARQTHDPKHDVVYAIVPQTKLIKTAWLQDKNDAHKTLRRDLYDKP